MCDHPPPEPDPFLPQGLNLNTLGRKPLGGKKNATVQRNKMAMIVKSIQNLPRRRDPGVYFKPNCIIYEGRLESS